MIDQLLHLLYSISILGLALVYILGFPFWIFLAYKRGKMYPESSKTISITLIFLYLFWLYFSIVPFSWGTVNNGRGMFIIFLLFTGVLLIALAMLIGAIKSLLFSKATD